MPPISDNLNYRQLFSDNAEPVTIDFDGDDENQLVLVCLNGDNEVITELTVPVHNTPTDLDLRGLFNGLPIFQAPTPVRGHFLDAHLNYICNENVNLQIRNKYGSTLAERKYLVIKGGVTGQSSRQASETFMRNSPRFLTQRPQINTTYRWGMERLFIVVAAQNEDNITNLEIKIKIYYDDGSSQILAEKHTDIHHTALYSALVDLFCIDEGDLDLMKENIVAYDVFFIFESEPSIVTTSAPIRFVIAESKRNYRGFIYRNPVGGFDTVYSKGALKIVPEYEISAFRYDYSEEELHTGAIEYIEAGTGPIDNSAVRRQWLDFLRSKEKFMFDQSGNIFRIILDDSSPELEFLSLNEFTFRFHMADAPKGNGAPAFNYQQNLEEFN